MNTEDWNSQVLSLVANREKILRYAFLLQFIAAVPFLWFATITGKQHAHLLVSGTHTTGTIVSVVPVRASYQGSGTTRSSSTSFQPVVSFVSGTDEFRFQEWKGTSISSSVGTKVSVIFDPSDPDIAMMDRGYLNYLPWAPCAAIGLFLLVVATKGFLRVVVRRTVSRAMGAS